MKKTLQIAELLIISQIGDKGTVLLSPCIQSVYKMYTQDRLGKDSIDKDSIDKERALFFPLTLK